MTKREVRELAREAGLVVAEKGESMEVCFVAGGIREFVEEQVAAHPDRFAAAALGAPGPVVDAAGGELGEGEPAYRYTVGQRRGLGVAGGERFTCCVSTPRRTACRWGARRRCWRRACSAPVDTGSQGTRRPEVEATVKIRSRHPGVAARIRALGGGRCAIEFETPQRGVAPGQAAVFYDGDRVLGGCWIEDRT